MIRSTIFFVAAAAVLHTAAIGATADQAALRTTFEKDKAACQKKTTPAERSTCMREAGAAYDAARQGQLRTPVDQQRAAQARCDRLPAADRPDCLARARGEGTAEGSVEGGGVLRETVTRTVMPAASAASDAASAPQNP